MPRVKKTVRKTKNKNKNKVVVRNVININSNNKRKGITKPSFAQLSQQPRSQGSTVVSHFIQQPTSAYNPQVESGLVKSLEIARDLITRSQEREANLIRENQSRLSTIKMPEEEKREENSPLINASQGRALTFEYSPNSPIIEKGGGGGSSKKETKTFRERFSTPFKSILGGRRPEEAGRPQANALEKHVPAKAGELQSRLGAMDTQLQELYTRTGIEPVERHRIGDPKLSKAIGSLYRGDRENRGAGFPQGSAFYSPKRTSYSDIELQNGLNKMSNKELDDLFDDITDEKPPSKKADKIERLISFYRDDVKERVFTTEKKAGLKRP